MRTSLHVDLACLQICQLLNSFWGAVKTRAVTDNLPRSIHEPRGPSPIPTRSMRNVSTDQGVSWREQPVVPSRFQPLQNFEQMPTLYPHKELVLSIFDGFDKHEKMRDVHTSRFHRVSCRDLCYVSENEGFRFGNRTLFWSFWGYHRPLPP